MRQKPLICPLHLRQFIRLRKILMENLGLWRQSESQNKRQGSESHCFSFDSVDQTMKSESAREPPVLADFGMPPAGRFRKLCRSRVIFMRLKFGILVHL